MPHYLVDKLIRTRRRTLELQITPMATVIVRAPKHTPVEIIHKFIDRKSKWIINKQSFIQANLSKRTEHCYESGEKFSYLGQKYGLTIVPEQKQKIMFNGYEFLLSAKNKHHGKKIFEKWYRAEAYRTIKERVAYFANITGLYPGGIKITGAKKRFGSCSPHNDLCFTWRLILAPLSVIDYVVVHELAHLAERNHSKRFWDKVRMYLPNYKEERNWLKSNSMMLSL